MRKTVVLLLVFCLMVLAVPPKAPSVSAAGSSSDYFIFPTEQYNSSSARVVLTDHVDLSGSINNVIGTSISYTVDHIIMDGTSENVVGSNANQTSNIQITGTNLKILNIQLFPGLNRITFKGLQGFAEVSGAIYIEYRNSPSLYDLTANIDGNPFEVQESGTTVVYSAASRNKSNYDINITGKAPNADKVTVIVNNKSYSYTVSATNGYSFAASPVNVVKGKNLVTIRVYNSSQYVETTREIAFYNGEVTFYDMQLSSGTKSVPLETTPNFSVATGDMITVKGKVILPLKVTPFDVDGNGTIDTGEYAYLPDISDVVASTGIQVSLNSGTFAAAAVTAPSTSPTPSDTYITVDFTKNIGAVGGVGLEFDSAHTLKFHGTNYVKTPFTTDTTSDFAFRLRDAAKPYIYQINYLPGYSATTQPTDLETMTGSPLAGTNVSSLPIGVEILVGNPTGSTTVGLSGVSTVSGSAASSTYTGMQITTPDYYVTKTVDGYDQQFQRIFMNVSKLPTAGSQTLEFTLNTNGSSATAAINLLYGPYVKYNTVYDGMIVNYDTTRSDAQDFLLDQTFQQFSGQLLNVSNPDDIRYENVTTPTPLLQSVFFYINNIEIHLKPVNSTDPTKFMLDPDPDNLNNAFGALYKGGANEVRFVFRTQANSYEQKVIINIVPTNLPVIPVADSSGVFPYSIGQDVPLPNDPNFPLQGTVYTTKEAEMNVYGTFDFIDLGDTQAAVDAKLAALGAGKSNYILKISSGDTDITWTLNNRFSSSGSSPVTLNGTGIINPDVNVTYDFDSQTFAFQLNNEKLPLDGSAKVYTISVYNTGTSGPRAQYRLEVDPTSIPYTIIAPIQEKRMMNQSFVEVILTSPGAQNVTVDKTEARRITYLDYAHLVSGLPTKVDAFSALVTGLKPNKQTAIKLTITNGTSTINDSINVTYTPESIPGGQTMEPLKTSLNEFQGDLALKFPSGTNLIRTDYNVPDNYKGQVYSGNNILFAVSNPVDGVVDRHDFESVPADFDLKQNLGSIYFSASFPDRFIKDSPVYWIDAGQADDVLTPSYDPITSGVDPEPFSVEDGVTQSFFYERDPSRELIPSERGTLTLAYDSAVRQGAGTTVTVFHFDPYAKQWDNIGGLVNEKKNTITVPFDHFGYYVAAKLSYGFNDITDHPYAREAMESIFSKGVMNAIDPSGVFGTDLYVTRGEFTRMLVRALDLPLNYDGAKHFGDIGDTGSVVSMDAIWDYRYIETAARAGFVKGTQPKVFQPDNSITRQDAAVMIAKATNLKLDTSVASVQKALQKAFKDEGSIDFYAQPSVAAILKKNFINGSPVDVNDASKGYVFEPESRLLRSDAAIIVAKIMASLKKLPSIYAK